MGLNGQGNRTQTQAIGKAMIRAAEIEKLERAFQFFLKAMNYPQPLREYEFSPSRKWRADFAWPDQNLLVEIDGGIWMKGGGAHGSPHGILRDINKSNEAVRLGWRNIRVTEEMLRPSGWVDLDKLLRGFFV